MYVEMKQPMLSGWLKFFRESDPATNGIVPLREIR